LGPLELALGTKSAQQRAPHALPGAVLRPGAETTPTGRRRAVYAWDIFPRAAGLQHEEDAVECELVVIGFPAWTRVLLRDQRCNDSPLCSGSAPDYRPDGAAQLRTVPPCARWWTPLINGFPAGWCWRTRRSIANASMSISGRFCRPVVSCRRNVVARTGGSRVCAPRCDSAFHVTNTANAPGSTA
jgi:hypothetical protein